MLLSHSPKVLGLYSLASEGLSNSKEVRVLSLIDLVKTPCEHFMYLTVIDRLTSFLPFRDMRLPVNTDWKFFCRTSACGTDEYLEAWLIAACPPFSWCDRGGGWGLRWKDWYLDKDLQNMWTQSNVRKNVIYTWQNPMLRVLCMATLDTNIQCKY